MPKKDSIKNEPIIKGKKRGRKPLNNTTIMKNEAPQEDESIVIKMPLQLSDLVEENDTENDKSVESDDISNMFVKKNTKLKNCEEESEEDDNDDDKQALKNKIRELEKIINDIQIDQIGIKNRKVTSTKLNFRNSKNENINWPEHINCRCWWDGFKFSTPPIPIPLMKTGDIFIITEGYFCSFNCAMAYLLDKGGSKSKEQITLLNQLYHEMYDKNDTIYPASNWRCIDEYYGNITIEKFRNELINIRKEHIYFVPPLKSLVPQIEETTRNEFTETEKFTMSVNSLDPNNLIKLKRSKPIVNTKYQLDKTIGLKIKKKKKHTLDS
jgi:hypothetical protein